MAKEKNKKQDPLTLDGLVKYNQDVLFPFMEEHFATKEDLENFATKEDVTGIKDEILTGQDEILKKLDVLITEKEAGDLQDKKQKKILAIHNKALKGHGILSLKELQEITKLEFF